MKEYFGLSRTAYLQTLANRWGDFGVAWNFEKEDGNIGFTKRRTVLELWQEQHCRLEKVMHRQAMPIEHFVEIDDESWFEANKKKKRAIILCRMFDLQYAIYKSRKGYHISVLDPQKMLNKDAVIRVVGSDKGMGLSTATWSMEWSKHWKKKDFVISLVYASSGYADLLLGKDNHSF